MRIKELQRAYALRLLLVHVDVEDVAKPLGDVARAALLNDVTLVCAWSAQVGGCLEGRGGPARGGLHACCL